MRSEQADLLRVNGVVELRFVHVHIRRPGTVWHWWVSFSKGCARLQEPSAQAAALLVFLRNP